MSMNLLLHMVTQKQFYDTKLLKQLNTACVLGFQDNRITNIWIRTVKGFRHETRWNEVETGTKLGRLVEYIYSSV